VVKRILTFLSLISFSLSAQDIEICHNQQDFILGHNNFVKKFKVEKCEKKKESNRCKCSELNKPIIGPNNHDQKTITNDLVKDIKSKFNNTLSSLVSNIIDNFIKLDQNFTLNDSALKKCSLINFTNISCGTKKSTLAQSFNWNGQKTLKDSQCALNKSYNSSYQCHSGNKSYLPNQKSCLNRAQSLSILDSQELELTLDSLLNNDLDDSIQNHKDSMTFLSVFDNNDIEKERFRVFLGTLDRAKNKHQLSELVIAYLNTKNVKDEVSRHEALKCEQNFSNLQKILCIDPQNISKVESELLNKLKPSKTKAIESSMSKEEQKENYYTQQIKYQKFLYYSCFTKEKKESKDNETLSSSFQSLNDNLPNSSIITKESFINQHEILRKNICENLLKKNGKPFSLSKILSSNGCLKEENINSNICIDLKSYVTYQTKKTLNSNITQDIHQPQLSEQMQIIAYGKVIKPNKTKSNDVGSRNKIELEKDSKVSIKNEMKKSKTNSGRTVSGSKVSQLQNDTKGSEIIQKTLNEATSRSNSPIVKSPQIYNTRKSKTSTTRNIPVNTDSKASTTYGDPYSKIGKMSDDLQDVINEIKEQNFKKAPKTANTKKKRRRRRRKQNKDISDFTTKTANSNNNEEEFEKYTDPKFEESKPSSDKATFGTTKKRGIASNSTPDAFLNVITSAPNENGEAIDELELNFTPGQKPDINKLEPKEIERILSYIEKNKTFILTKVYNLDGTPTTVSTKIIALANGKFEIKVIGNKNTLPKKYIANLQLELSKALSSVKSSTKVSMFNP
jgi:hypothetical protein